MTVLKGTQSKSRGRPKPKPANKAGDLARMVNSTLGAGTIVMGSDPSLVVEYLPTGVLPIDVLLEGGFPRGRFSEVYGDASTLKSYVGLGALSVAQRNGLTGVLVDTEHAFDPAWAASLGVDVGSLLLVHPATGEEAVDATEIMIREGVDLVVWDSVAATLPKAEANIMSQDKTQMARQAAFMSAALRKLTAANSRTALVCINQTRTNIGVMMGDPTTVPGGKALPFYASYRTSLKRVGKITHEEKVHDGEGWRTTKVQTGVKFRAFVEKSKLNRPFREVFFSWDLVSNRIDETGFLISQGIELGVIQQRGKSGWQVTLGKNQWTARGREALHGLIERDEDLHARMVAACRGDREPPAKPKVAGRKRPSSTSSGRGTTRRPVPSGSRATVRPKTTSTKSRTPTGRTQSRPGT